jgi:hypothetical protein
LSETHVDLIETRVNAFFELLKGAFEMGQARFPGLRVHRFPQYIMTHNDPTLGSERLESCHPERSAAESRDDNA